MTFDFRGMAPLLQVFDMPTSMRFYRDVLGFEVVSASGADDSSDWVWLQHGGVHVMLNTAYEAGERPTTPDSTRIGSHGDIGLFISCRDLDGMCEHLTGHGLSVEPPRTAPYGMTQLFVKDPDGYTLCFQWPSGGDAGARWSWYGEEDAGDPRSA
jgi:catechol 2,3-dioxygenase-like lactoylglutathione lyase family enzyme